VASLRLYTTSSYTLINNPLRKSYGMSAAELQRRPHPLAVTTFHITSGLKKLRALNFRSFRESSLNKDDTLRAPDAAAPGVPGGRTLKRQNTIGSQIQTSAHSIDKYLWRGLKDLTVSDHFMSYGGSELACMSTSESLSVIANYALSDSPLLFRIKIETPMDRGASLKWLSTFPHEDEVLYPPLTYLQPLLKQKIRGKEGGMVVTLKAVFPS